MNNKIDIIIIRGAPGAGKSQTAKCLSKHFPHGIRMEIDNLRSMVISVDWTNQNEHKTMLNISTNLVYGFIKYGFKPVMVIDTFSDGKIVQYLESLNQLDKNLSIRIFGLYTNEQELKSRIEARNIEEFRDFEICKRLNDDVIKNKYNNEQQINTTGLSPTDTANLIINCLNDY